MPCLSPYSLIPSEQSDSDLFYAELSVFTDLFLKNANEKLGEYSRDFNHFLSCNYPFEKTSPNELLLQAVLPGIYWKNYHSDACQSSGFYISLLEKLYRLRKKSPALKSGIDKIRGRVGYQKLHHPDRVNEMLNLRNFKKMLDWLRATGEFSEEVKKLDVWNQFLNTMDDQYVQHFFESSLKMASEISEKGEKSLGKYLCNWEKFQEHQAINYRNREDYFFTARKKNEYYLNMAGAEILNRELRDAFDKTPRKVLLLPTCMRNNNAVSCKAEFDGTENKCVACSNHCNIGRIANRMKNHNIPTYLIPHSSGFSKTLEKWKEKDDTSLIGVACILNLLTGGYEMKNLGISSQCVFLDFCGCQKHWHPEGVATDLNLNQLENILKKEKASLLQA